jgi:hypothetical protein
LINLSIELKTYDADAVSFVQNFTITFAYTNTEIFLDILRDKKQSEINTLVTFLADVENHKSYSIYQNVIQKLKLKNRKKLSDLFVKAMTLRMHKHGH